MTDEQTQAMNEIMASIRKAVVAPEPGDEDEPLVLDRDAAVDEPRAGEVTPASEPTAMVEDMPAREAAPVSMPALAPEAHPAPTAATPVLPPAGGETTLEGLVRSLLEPALKSWLDANLPEIVERVAKSEIGRLTRP